MVLIKNVHIIDKYTDCIEDVLIQEGKIHLIGKEKIQTYLASKEAPLLEESIIDGSGKYLSPSFVDLHFHLRNPGLSYKQTYEEASAACIKGGYTKVVAMANTNPVCDKAEIVEEVHRAMQHLPLEVIQAGAVSVGLAGIENVDYAKMIEQTKIFSDDGKNVDNPQVMKKALSASKELGFIVMDHDEPETENVVRNLELARETGGRLHFCHISKKESIEAIRTAKAEGVRVSYEVTPHHIFAYDLDYRVNPPIGNAQDHLAILAAIRNEEVDAIATDHAPHSEEDKCKGAPGIANIETAFAMVRKIFFDNHISLQKQIELMSNNPSEMLGIDNRIAEGAIANLVLYSDKEAVIQKESFATRSKNTPFDGAKVRGIIEYTLVGGKIYDHGQN